MFEKLVTRFTEEKGSEAGGKSALEKLSEEDEYSSDELDQVFHILRNQRRRDVLRFLSNATKQVTVSDLAEHIAARECDKPISQLKSQERKRVYVGLYQGHLPKMDDFDIVSFDSDRGTIEPGPDLGQFEEFLPDAEESSVEKNLLEVSKTKDNH